MLVVSCCSISWHYHTIFNLPFARFAVEALVCGLLRTLSSALCCSPATWEPPRSSACTKGCQLPSTSPELWAWPVHLSWALQLGKIWLQTSYRWWRTAQALPNLLCCFTFLLFSCHWIAGKMIAITENSVVCAALDFSIMSRHYDLG